MIKKERDIIMIKGIGIDIIELERIEHMIQQQPRFIQRILSPREQEKWQALSGKRQVEFMAGRFAVKEALAKALGTGIGKGFGWQDVSILSDELGAPQINWNNRNPTFKTHLSISHSANYVVAQVILEESHQEKI
jgi:holo-[acyl-carrier protein] synthase